MEETRKSAQEFLDLIKKSRKGKFKVYIGMSAGVGKSYRMLQEAHTLLKNGIDVKIELHYSCSEPRMIIFAHAKTQTAGARTNVRG